MTKIEQTRKMTCKTGDLCVDDMNRFLNGVDPGTPLRVRYNAAQDQREVSMITFEVDIP